MRIALPCFLKAASLHRIAAMLLAAVFLFSTSVAVTGCTKNADGSITVNTTTAAKLITAAAYAGNKIEALPAISEHLTQADRDKYDAAVKKIQAMASTVSSNTGGSLTLALGTNWASDLLNDLQTLIDVATPIVAVYAPEVKTYLTTVSELIPLIEAFLPTSDPRHIDALPISSGSPLLLRTADLHYGVVDQSSVLAKIYAGPVSQ